MNEIDESEPITNIVPAPRTPSMLAETQLIDDICNCVADGATDTAICRALGIYPSTFTEWKKKGRDGIEPYRTFYIRYEQATGLREIEWAKQACRDAKWALTHHPKTKVQWSEMRNFREERVNVEKLNAKKDAIGVELDKYFGGPDGLGDEGAEENQDGDSQEALPQESQTA